MRHPTGSPTPTICNHTDSLRTEHLPVVWGRGLCASTTERADRPSVRSLLLHLKLCNPAKMSRMVTDEDIKRLRTRIEELDLDLKPLPRGWQHMGAVICDAALQRRAVYKTTVRPRIEELIAAWPDADTLSGFTRRRASSDLTAVIRWQDPQKLTVIDDLVEAFNQAGIETTDDLSQRLLEPEFRGSLRRIRYVGPKTVDYLAILTGSDQHIAVDTHIQRFAQEAGFG